MSTASDGYSGEIRPLVYDLQMGPGRPDVPFWVAWCREAGGPVLDLGCGTGRITFPLAEAGLEVVGLDASERMLLVARRRLQEAPSELAARVRFVHGDMREPVAGPFACAIIPLTTFALLLTDNDRRRTLDAVRTSLRPGGSSGFILSSGTTRPVSSARRRFDARHPTEAWTSWKSCTSRTRPPAACSRGRPTTHSSAPRISARRPRWCECGSVPRRRSRICWRGPGWWWTRSGVGMTGGRSPTGARR